MIIVQAQDRMSSSRITSSRGTGASFQLQRERASIRPAALHGCRGYSLPGWFQSDGCFELCPCMEETHRIASLRLHCGWPTRTVCCWRCINDSLIAKHIEWNVVPSTPQDRDFIICGNLCTRQPLAHRIIKLYLLLSWFTCKCGSQDVSSNMIDEVALVTLEQLGL